MLYYCFSMTNPNKRLKQSQWSVCVHIAVQFEAKQVYPLSPAPKCSYNSHTDQGQVQNIGPVSRVSTCVTCLSFWIHPPVTCIPFVTDKWSCDISRRKQWKKACILLLSPQLEKKGPSLPLSKHKVKITLNNVWVSLLSDIPFSDSSCHYSVSVSILSGHPTPNSLMDHNHWWLLCLSELYLMFLLILLNSPAFSPFDLSLPWSCLSSLVLQPKTLGKNIFGTQCQSLSELSWRASSLKWNFSKSRKSFE